MLQPGGAGTPELSLIAALTAIVVGTLLGAVVLALAGIPSGHVSWWASAWSSFAQDIGFTPAGWMSASILSFCAAGTMTLLVRGTAKLLRH